MSEVVEKGYIVKTNKYRAILNQTQTDIVNNWIRLGKEFYNLLVEQRLEAEEFNKNSYYQAYPDKLEEKIKKEEEYKAKVDAEIAAGKRKPKKVRVKHITPLQKRYPELQNLNTSTMTFCQNIDSIQDLGASYMAISFKKTRENLKDPIEPNFCKIEKKKGKVTNKIYGTVSPIAYYQIGISWQGQSRYGTQFRNKYPEFNTMPSEFWTAICKQVDKAFSDYIGNKIKYNKMSPDKKEKSKYPLPPKFIKHSDDFSLIGKSGVNNNSNVSVIKLDQQKKVRVMVFSKKYVKEGLKIIYHKPIKGSIVVCSLSKQKGKFFLCVTHRTCKQNLKPKHKAVGVDLGVARNIQLSDGSYKNLPLEYMKRLEDKKKKKQASLKRMVVRSKNYNKKQKEISKISAKIANIRKYHIDMFATEIVKDHENIIIEDLSVKNMTKSAKGNSETPGKNVAQKRGLNRSMLNIAPYAFRLALENKAKEYDRMVIAVDPKYTSQTCSSCGHVSKDNRKSQDKFMCVSCGHEMNADHNAAINILNRGIND